MERDVIRALDQELAEGKAAALAVLVENKGSVPGKEGSMMMMRTDGSIVGTIGGGAIEFDVMKRIEEVFKTGGESFEFDYSLTEDSELKMACGGDARGFVRVFAPKEKILIFGAGHVSRKICSVLKLMNFSVYVIDDREDFKDLEEFSSISDYLSGDMKEAVEKVNIDGHTYVVIMTRGHAHDYEAAKLVLGKPYAYLGMMGSKRKAASVKKSLIEEGFDADEVNSMRLPIGLDISDGSVEEIAISVIAQILKVKKEICGDTSKKSCPSQ